MMVGIAAFGNAVGAAAKGYMEGEKFRSEMEDAEQVRGLRKIQMERGELENKQIRKKQAGQDALDAIVAEYMPQIEAASKPAATPAAGAPAQPAAAPVDTGPAAPGETPAAPAPKMGLSGPASPAAPAAAPAAPSKSPWELRQEMFTRLNMEALRQADGPEGVQKAMENSLGMMKKFRDARSDEALSAMQFFAQGGSQQEAETMLARAGMPMPQGSTWKVEKRPVYPGAKATIDDVVVTSPDGRTVSMNQVMASRMDPKDFFTSNLKVAELQQTAAYQEGTLQETKRYHDILATQAGAHLQIARMQTELMKRQADLAEKKFNFDAVQAMNLKAADESARLLGIPKELTAKERTEMDPKVVEQYDLKRNGMLARQATVLSNYSLNNSRANDGKELVSLALVDKATTAAKNTPDLVKTDDGISYYVMIANRKVAVLPPAQKAQPPAGPEAPAARPGVQGPQPRAVDASGDVVPGAPSTLSTGYATPDARGLLRTPNYSAGANTFAPTD